MLSSELIHWACITQTLQVFSKLTSDPIILWAMKLLYKLENSHLCIYLQLGQTHKTMKIENAVIFVRRYQGVTFNRITHFAKSGLVFKQLFLNC